MKSQLHLKTLLILAVTTVFLGSCADLDITKRRYRPGFHVDAGGKKEHRKAEQAARNTEGRHTSKALESIDVAEASARVQPEVAIATASTTVVAQPLTAREVRKAENKAILKEAFAPLSSPSAYAHSLADLRAELKTAKIKKAIYDQPQEEKQGWTIVGIISMPLGIVALIMAIVTLASVVSLVIAGGPFPVFSFIVFGILAIFLGIAAMVLGVIGKKQAQNGKRGKGFAIVGLITGILGMVFGIVFTLVGGLFSIIRNNN